MAQMKHTYVTVTPAYGRDYTTQAQIKQAWNANQDFKVADFFSGYHGSMVNKQDVETLNKKGDSIKIMVRYSKQTKIYQVN